MSLNEEDLTGQFEGFGGQVDSPKPPPRELSKISEAVKRAAVDSGMFLGVSGWPSDRKALSAGASSLECSPITTPHLESILTAPEKPDGWSSQLIFVSHHGRSDLPSYSELFDRMDVARVTLTDEDDVADRPQSTIAPANEATVLITAPWGDLPNIITVIAGRRYYDDIVRPTVADVQFEYLEAMRRGEDRMAACIKWLGLLRILVAAAISPVMRICRMFSSQKA